MLKINNPIPFILYKLAVILCDYFGNKYKWAKWLPTKLYMKFWPSNIKYE